MFFKNKATQMDDKTLTPEILVSELLRERKRDRRLGYLRTFLIMGSVVAYAGVSMFMFNAKDGSMTSEPFAAVVPITGPIGADTPAGYAQLEQVLEAAFSNTMAKGVVLSINSPGGTPVQSSLVHDLVLELKAKYKKPVIAVGEDMMTSGAYFIAVAADTIVANRSTVTGSIGVISAGFGYSGLLDKLGVERRVTTAGNSKNMLDPFSPASDTDHTKQKELLTDIHGHFKDVVIAGRGDRLKMDTPGLFEGTVWTGDKAVANGIIDELGNVRTTVKKHFGIDKTIVFHRKKPLLNSLMDSIGITSAISALIADQGATARPSLTPQ